MFVQTPSLVVSEFCDGQGTRGEVPIAIVESDEDAAVSETDDVCTTRSSNIGDVANVPVYAPTASVVPKVGEDAVSIRPSAVSVVGGYENTGLAEAYEVASAVTGRVSDKADVLIDAPSGGVGQVGKYFVGSGERIVAQDEDAGVAKANDVRCPWATGLYCE